MNNPMYCYSYHAHWHTELAVSYKYTSMGASTWREAALKKVMQGAITWNLGETLPGLRHSAHY